MIPKNEQGSESREPKEAQGKSVFCELEGGWEGMRTQGYSARRRGCPKALFGSENSHQVASISAVTWEAGSLLAEGAGSTGESRGAGKELSRTEDSCGRHVFTE